LTDTPRLLGHRGALARAPENTLASFERALLDGAEGFEFDVRVTRDGVPILLHDGTLNRTTDGSGEVAELYREDLEDLDAGSHFSDEFAGERLPDLQEILAEYLGSVMLAMELKVTLPLPVFRDLADWLRQFPDPELHIVSFDALPLAHALDFLPTIPRAQILRLGDDLPSEGIISELGLSGVVARVEDIDKAFAEECAKRSLGLFAYTVNDPDQAAFLADLGVDAIISDDPKAIHPVLA
jgi:glycerophosphoryl diester phosphodiesterase